VAQSTFQTVMSAKVSCHTA